MQGICNYCASLMRVLREHPGCVLHTLESRVAFREDRGIWGYKEAVATVDTNVYGTIRMTEAALPLLKRSAQGRIVK